VHTAVVSSRGTTTRPAGRRLGRGRLACGRSDHQRHHAAAIPVARKALLDIVEVAISIPSDLREAVDNFDVRG